MCQKTKFRLEALKKKLTEHLIDALVIPSSDPHQSEYLPDHWKIREWISGFTGSAGLAIITKTMSGLWTDSRYFIQAEQELKDTGITIFRMGEKDVPTPVEFLCDQLPPGAKVVLNAQMWSIESIEKYKLALQEKNIQIILNDNLAEEVWNLDERPLLPTSKIFIHPLKYAGKSIQEKLTLVRSEMKKLEVDLHLITTLDDIAWLFNLRGSDVAHNPVFLSHAVITPKEALLFVDQSKLDDEISDHLTKSGVAIQDYNSIDSYLSKVKTKILVNPEDCNGHLYQLLNEEKIERGPTITRLLKACKTHSEIKNIDNVMVKDGIALAHAFFEMSERINHNPLTEAEFAALIAKRRSEQKGYYGESFPAIVGYQANGAIVHYRPTINESATIRPEGLLLCDSGGQYMDGTTDITRTIAVGAVTDAQRDAYTRVLKGHIAIDQAVFPKGTTGGMLDILARQYLWRNGQNYGHGTGHGVGYFLNVHEPPQGISQGPGSRATTAFQPGMLTSNEPGYYEAGAYGVRIENLIITEESEHKDYLCHRHVTLFPIDTSIIVRSLMTRAEINWINDYHKLVASKLLPHLTGPVKAWMEEACQFI